MDGSTPVNAQAEAVEEIARAVRAFTEQQTHVLTSVRASLAKQSQRAQAEVQTRRRHLERMRAAADAADAALARCRENCSGLAQAAEAARRRRVDADHSLARARKAADMLDQASTKLAAVARGSEQVTAEHGRAAVTACHELADRLRSFLRHAASTVEVVSTVANAASQVGQAMPAQSFLAPPASETTISARAETNAKDQNQLWADAEKKRLEERAGDWIDRRD